MELKEKLFEENLGGEILTNDMEDIQEKTGYYLTELLAYFDEENQDRAS